MFNPTIPNLGGGTGSTPIAPNRDESKLPSQERAPPGPYGIILKGGMTTIKVDLARSPRQYDEFGKEDFGQQHPQSGAPSNIEPGAPRRSYLEAIRASNQPRFSHRKNLFPEDYVDNQIPPSSPPMPLMRTGFGGYPPKHLEIRKKNKNSGRPRATPGSYKPNLERTMEAAIIHEFIEYKEAQRIRLGNDFYSDPRWKALILERDAWQYQWAHGDLDQRKTATTHGLPDVNGRIDAVYNSYKEAEAAISAELAGMQFNAAAGLTSKPFVQKNKRWTWDVTGYSHSLTSRVLLPIERPIVNVGPEVLPPDPVIDFGLSGGQGLTSRSSSTSVNKMFGMVLDNTESMSVADRYEFYKTHGHYAARRYLQQVKSRSDQPSEELDVPKWFPIFESQNRVVFSTRETAHGRFQDLNFHLGRLAMQVRDGSGNDDLKKATFDRLMARIQAAQRVVAERDRYIVENRMRAQAPSSSATHRNAMQRIAAELSAENAAHDRAKGRPLGSTADEERNDAAKRLDSRNSRRSAHF
ncbi:hypothetical protein PG995_011176 [Apiospora arundinis]|uniref:Uncharacterized protein n=1 Tax=Apiospora arundinis TaxID=335852 RepID=A0ABR2IVK6_9PEZI